MCPHVHDEIAYHNFKGEIKETQKKNVDDEEIKNLSTLKNIDPGMYLHAEKSLAYAVCLTR